MKKIKKAYWGLQFNSFPLTSLNPTYSANQLPNFNNAYLFGLSQLSLGLGSDIQDRWNLMGRDLENLKFNMGLSFSASPDPNTRQYGQLLMQNSMNLLNLPRPSNSSQQQNPNDLYANDVARLTGSDFDWKAGFDAAGQAVGNIPGQAGKIGQLVLGAAGTIKDAWSNLSEIRTLQKKGVEGLGKAKAGNIGAIVGAVSDLASGFLPEKTEYSGELGDLTQTLDSVYDGISDAAMSFGPIGMLVGGIMKGGKLLGGVTNSLGGGTDAMTTTDAILGSAFFNLTPIGLINGFGGSTTDTITKNLEAFEQVGSSYTGSNQNVDLAVQKSGKKYGLFSRDAKLDADKEIAEAARQLNIINSIANDASDRFEIRNAMSAINGNRRLFAMQGGYNQSSIRFGRKGMVLSKKIISNYKIKKQLENFLNYNKLSEINTPSILYEIDLEPYVIKEFKKGGKINNSGILSEVDTFLENTPSILYEIDFVDDPFEIYYNSLPENLKDSTLYRVRDYWEFNGRPKNFEEAKAKGMFYLNEKGIYESRSVQEKFKEGGKIDTLESNLLSKTTILKEIEVYDILEFKEGGSFNIIPEGALHARKHNMEIEGITPKGIPVVSLLENGKVELQAEIEKEEIILRLSLTKRLEELAKENTDEAAIEAGKLLVNEILNNTIDNTNTLL